MPALSSLHDVAPFPLLRITIWPSTEKEDISHLSTIKGGHTRKEKYIKMRTYKW